MGAHGRARHQRGEHDVEHVIFTFSTAPHAVMLNMVRRCRELGVSASLVPGDSIVDVQIDKAGVLRRFLPRAHGRATPFRKQLAHIHVKLAEVQGSAGSKVAAWALKAASSITGCSRWISSMKSTS